MPCKPKTPAKPYEPTEAEQAAVARFKGGRSRLPAVEFDETGEVPQLDFKHEDPAVAVSVLRDRIGATEPGFFFPYLAQLTSALSRGSKPDADAVNFGLAVAAGIQPRDQVEAMLAAQMAAVHMATMTFARRLANVDNIPQQDSAERAFNKLTRTYAKQMEALKRYRTGGEQKVTVQHVTVNDGGQAVVGNVSKGGGDGKK